MASPAIGTGTGEVQTTIDSGNVTAAVNTPTNAVTGDLLVFTLVTNAAKTVTLTGWNNIDSQAGTTAGKIQMWWRLHDGSSSSYSATWTGQGNTGLSASIVRITGADTSSPVDVSAKFDSAFTSSATNSAPTVTTTVADTLLLNAYGTTSNVTRTPASSQTEVLDIASTVSVTAYELTKLAVAGTGATGAKNTTASVSCFWVSMSVAIKPSSPIKSVASVTYAQVKTVAGVPKAQIKKVAGVG